MTLCSERYRQKGTKKNWEAKDHKALSVTSHGKWNLVAPSTNLKLK